MEDAVTKCFSFLSDVVGLPALRAHLWQVIGIGNSVHGKAQFEKRFPMRFQHLSRSWNELGE